MPSPNIIRFILLSINPYFLARRLLPDTPSQIPGPQQPANAVVRVIRRTGKRHSPVSNNMQRALTVYFMYVGGGKLSRNAASQRREDAAVMLVLLVALVVLFCSCCLSCCGTRFGTTVSLPQHGDLINQHLPLAHCVMAGGQAVQFFRACSFWPDTY